jgi:two-component system, NarL family, nitrate/nitrite response regulator NarL
MQILLVDDHRLFLDGMSVLLRELVPHIRIASATTIAQAIEIKGPIDLILLDLHLPDSFGFGGIERLKFVHEGTPVVVVSSEESPSHIEDCINHGAMAFVPKSSSTAELFSALKRVLGGESYLPQHSLNNSQGFAAPAFTKDKIHLSDRRREVLMKLVQGKSNKIIAREMGISDTTVKTHVIAVLAALGVSNRTEAVYRAVSLGIELRPFTASNIV